MSIDLTTLWHRLRRHLRDAARYYDARAAGPCPGAAACWRALGDDARSIADRIIATRLPS